MVGYFKLYRFFHGDLLPLWLYVHFFCSSKRNEPKKKRPKFKDSVNFGVTLIKLIATVLPSFEFL